MYIPIIQFWRESNLIIKILIVLSMGLLASYPIYTNYYYGYGVEQFQRHLDLIAGKSMFFNPWQYRVFSPYIVEGIFQIFQLTIESWFGFEEKIISILPTESRYDHSQVILDLLRTKGFITYNAIFILVRIAQHITIFYLMFIYFRLFIKNEWLILCGIVFSSFLMGNSVNDSDLSLNTYTDIILYLLAVYVILGKRNEYLIIAITLVGSLNRETSLLIPFLYFVYKTDWSLFDFGNPFSLKIFPSWKTVGITIVSLIFFTVIFLMLRWYYGYAPQTYWRVASGWQMIRFNLFSIVSIKTYFEMFGTMVVLPLIVIYSFNKLSYHLKLFFIAFVPLWFGVHLYSVVAYQSRLFLVPTLIVLLPAFLERVEQYYLYDGVRISRK